MQEWLILQNPQVIYAVLFFALIGGSLGLPIPEDLPLFCAGIAVEQGRANVWLALAACYTAIVIGDCIVFHIGRFFGPAIFKKKLFRERVSKQRLAKIKRSLEKRSLMMIFIARHLFYVRTVTFLSCGALGMSRKRFLIQDALAAMISTPFMMWLGYMASEQYDEFNGVFEKIEKQILLWGIIILAIYLFYRLYVHFYKKSPEK